MFWIKLFLEQRQGGCCLFPTDEHASAQGDFYRLLDSEEPAPRRSFHLDKDEQLPRSFSIAARGGESQASFPRTPG